MNRILVLALAIVGVVFSVESQAQKLTKRPKPIRLTLNWKPEPQFGGFYAASEGRHFANENLNVQIQPGGSGTPTVQMVAAGKTEYAIVSADELVILNSKGGNLVALFAAYQTNPQGIMTHAARGFKSLDDVFGSSGELAIQRGLPYAAFLLSKYKNPKVKVVPYAGGIAQFAANKNHSQQCFVTSEPLLAKKKLIATKVFLVSESGFNPYTTVLVTTKDRVKTHSDEVKAVTRAVKKGWEDYLNDPSRFNKVMATINPSMDMQTMDESALAQVPLIQTEETKKQGLGVMTVERFAQLIDQMHDLKLIKTKPDPASLFLK